MKGQALTHHILLEVGRAPNTLFRQNVGQAWAGDATQAKRTMQVTLQPGDAVVRNARPVRMGLCEGSSDLIGFRSVVVTADMVGQKLAVFVALEVKGEGDRARPKQTEFVELVKAGGGIADFVRSVAEAEAALAG